LFRPHKNAYSLNFSRTPHVHFVSAIGRRFFHVLLQVSGGGDDDNDDEFDCTAL
jgi:hypothetical protein